jgi:hypothetical protein
MMKKNFQHIDEIRFLIIHLILVNHAMLSYALIRGKVDRTLLGLGFEFTSPALAMISGYLFFYATSTHFHFLEKARRRIPSLIVPYVIWSLGFFLIFYLVKYTVSNLLHIHYWYETVTPFKFRYAWDALKNPPLDNFWYLQNLIIVIPFNLLFYYLLKNRSLTLVFFLVLLFLYGYTSFPLYFSPRFLPYYFTGCYFGYHEMHLPRYQLAIPVKKFQTTRLLSTIWIPLILFLGIISGFIEYYGILRFIIKIAIVLFVMIFIYNLLDASPNGRVFRYLNRYKSYSFFLFAIHTFIFTLQRPIFKLVENQFSNKYFTLGFTLFSTVLTLVISLSLGIWTNKKWPGFYRFITGR